MAAKEKRLSYCLKHQERVTETRCAGCMKPICEDCTFSTELGKFCGSGCYEKRLASNERVEALKKEDDADRGPRMIRTLIRYAIVIILLVAAFALYPKLPASVRKPVDNFFKALHIK